MTRTPAHLRLGTRRSALARRQTALISARLEAAGWSCETVLFTTDGDVDDRTPLPAFGSRGVFTDTLERALREGGIDAAVHSLKDLPVEASRGLSLAAIGFREDAREVLIARDRFTLATLPRGGRVGTCSTRRQAQLLAARSDLHVVALRGNVDTRVTKALAGEYDAIVIAAAGVHRLDLTAHVSEYLPLEVMLPAPGQGALAVQCRADDAKIWRCVAALDESSVRIAVEAERAFLEGMGGGCEAPVAAYGQVTFVGAPRVLLSGIVASLDGSSVTRLSGEAPVSHARALGLSLARQALDAGALRRST